MSTRILLKALTLFQVSAWNNFLLVWQHMKIVDIQLTSKHQHMLIANNMHINYRPNTILTCYSSRKLGLVDYKS